jgi:hypothetical protein
VVVAPPLTDAKVIAGTILGVASMFEEILMKKLRGQCILSLHRE